MSWAELYRGLHWGDPGLGGTVRAFVASGPASEVAPIRSISYATRRDDATGRPIRSVWEHEFEHACTLLESATGGRLSHPSTPRDLVTLGVCVDLVTVSGARILTPGAVVAATRSGSLRIAWLRSPRYSLDCDPAIRITDRGIEG